jgi:hypothetical protein
LTSSWRRTPSANTGLPIAGSYVKLLVLLAPRKTALAGMRRSDLDDIDNPTLWTTPFELTKSKKSASKKRVYLTPLPALAQRIVKGLPKGGERLFPTLRIHSAIITAIVMGTIGSFNIMAFLSDGVPIKFVHARRGCSISVRLMGRPRTLSKA